MIFDDFHNVGRVFWHHHTMRNVLNNLPILMYFSLSAMQIQKYSVLLCHLYLRPRHPPFQRLDFHNIDNHITFSDVFVPKLLNFSFLLVIYNFQSISELLRVLIVFLQYPTLFCLLLKVVHTCILWVFVFF